MPISSKLSDRIRVGVALAALLVGVAALAQDSEVAILGRSGWGARDPVQAMTPHRPRRITIHHSAVRSNQRADLGAKLRNLQSFSQRAGSLADGRTKPVWADVPYHYYVDARGRIAEGRQVNFVGDTNTEYDPAGHIGIVVEGNFEIEQPSEAQLAALEKLIVLLARKHGIKADQIAGHRSFARTACPGKNLEAHLPRLRAAVAKALAG